jgi:hypothetical protein
MPVFGANLTQGATSLRDKRPFRLSGLPHAKTRLLRFTQTFHNYLRLTSLQTFHNDLACYRSLTAVEVSSLLLPLIIIDASNLMCQNFGTASARKPPYFNSKTHSGWSKGAGLRESGIGWNAIGRAYQGRWRK